MGPCARARALYKPYIGGQPRKKNNLNNDYYANLYPPWVLHDGILTFSYKFQEKNLWDHARARALQDYKPDFTPEILELQKKNINWRYPRGRNAIGID